MPPALPMAVEVGPGQSGPVGLMVILLLCALCVFLFRSMVSRIKRVPRSFQAPDGRPAGGGSISPRGDREDA